MDQCGMGQFQSETQSVLDFRIVCVGSPRHFDIVPQHIVCQGISPLQNRLILGPRLWRTRLIFTLERDVRIDLCRINAANQRPIRVNSTTHVGKEVWTRSNHIRDEHDDNARWHRSAHDREGPAFKVSSSWVAVQCLWPRRRLAQQLYFVTSIEPLCCLRHGQRNLGVAAAFAAFGTTKTYFHVNESPQSALSSALVRRRRPYSRQHSIMQHTRDDYTFV